MSNRITHGVLIPPVPCCDPNCPICGRHNGVSQASERGFSDPDDDENEDDDDDWDDFEDDGEDDWDDEDEFDEASGS
jgi:hypothetical protein